MFTIVSLPPLEPISADFVKSLLLSVEEALASKIMSKTQAYSLCEYLDCVTARVPGLDKAQMGAASLKLAEHLRSFADAKEQEQLSKRSPAAKALLRVLGLRTAHECENKSLARAWG